MYFIVTKNHLQMSCYRKQENGAKDAKPETEINNIPLTGFGQSSIKEMYYLKKKGKEKMQNDCQTSTAKKQNKLNDNTMAIYYGP